MWWILAIVVVALVAAGACWRLLSLRRSMPCPAWATALLENPYMEAVAGAEMLLDRAGVGRGMRVLDIGPGPGRLTLPAARRIGPEGRVTALEIQPRMVAMLERRVRDSGLENVEIVLGAAGAGRLRDGGFDRALLVTVLGEIVDKERALGEIHGLLRPGGVLSITEVLPDPHYQRRATVVRLARAAGFGLAQTFGTWVAFTVNLRKPGS